MKKLWGGRFSKKTDPLMEAFTSSIAFDSRLAEYDVLGSIAHARMLGKCNIIPKKDAAKITKALKGILSGLKKGTFTADAKSEDIHTDIQNKLYKKLGSTAKKLHAARSRNDQVNCDERLYCKDMIDKTAAKIAGLQKALLNLAKKNKGVIIPGYTHLQHAQPVALAHLLLAYVNMLERDKSRFLDAKRRVDISTLGSCAISGTSLKTDRKFAADRLGFAQVSDNSIDAVSDRDFIAEILAASAITGMHLSRFAEDMIIYSSSEFGFIDVSEAHSTGSSMMPHKKNPDALELIRGSAGKLYGNLVAILTTMKGLPSSYNRDMQHDKEPLFNSFDTLTAALGMFTAMVSKLKINNGALKRALSDESLYATDLAEYLIRKGVAFKEAHDAVGHLVRYSIDKNRKISALSPRELKGFSKAFEKDAFLLLDAKKSVSLKRSFGGTSFDNIDRQLKNWGRQLK